MGVDPTVSVIVETDGGAVVWWPVCCLVIISRLLASEFPTILSLPRDPAFLPPAPRQRKN